MTRHHQNIFVPAHMWWFIIIIISWSLMLWQDLQFCLSLLLCSFWCIITNHQQFCTNATSYFYDLSTQPLLFELSKNFARPSTPPIFISAIALFTQPQHHGTIPAKKFENEWSYQICDDHFSYFLPKSAPCDVIRGQPWTYPMYKKERHCRRFLTQAPPFPGSATVSFC